MFNPLKAELDKLRIILATASKQRHAILEQAELKFEVIVSNYAENLDRTQYTFSDYVQETAAGKAKAVDELIQAREEHADIIIAMDTMVCCGDQFYGKPSDRADAIATIRHLTNADIPSKVLTGVCIKYLNTCVKFTESTKVYMKPLSEEEILGYVDTGEPMGHAGSFAIQGIAASFVERIEGDFYNVIGLPLCAITKHLTALVLKKDIYQEISG